MSDEIDFSFMGQDDLRHPAFPYFKKAMKGVRYGQSETINAWEWFREGWGSLKYSLIDPHPTELKTKIYDQTLAITIPVDTLAFAALHSDFVYEMMGPEQRDPRERFSIFDTEGFARDVLHELKAELGEDGSTLVTSMFDQAIKNAIEMGTPYFLDSEDDDEKEEE